MHRVRVHIPMKKVKSNSAFAGIPSVSLGWMLAGFDNALCNAVLTEVSLIAHMFALKHILHQ